MTKGLDFGLPFFYRVALPGAVVGAVLLPLIHALFDQLGGSSDVQLLEDLGIAAIVGILLAIMNEPIYQFYEGRILWPKPIKDWATRRIHQRRLIPQANRQREAYQVDPTAYNQLSTALRQRFPTNDAGTWIASAPTQMGNILAAYETYPMRRYGMSAAFYWHRLWLAVGKDIRDEVDQAWASTDGLMHMAGGLLLAGLAYGLAAIALGAVALLGQQLPSVLLYPFAIAAIASAAFSCVPYWLSLPGHVANGEVFKSLFDLYRSTVRDLAPATADERAGWLRTWRALQYGAEPIPAPQPASLVSAAAADSVPAELQPTLPVKKSG